MITEDDINEISDIIYNAYNDSNKLDEFEALLNFIKENIPPLNKDNTIVKILPPIQ